MDSLQLLYIIEAIVTLLLGAVNCAITGYIVIHERHRFKVVGVMFSFLALGSICTWARYKLLRLLIFLISVINHCLFASFYKWSDFVTLNNCGEFKYCCTIFCKLASIVFLVCYPSTLSSHISTLQHVTHLVLGFNFYCRVNFVGRFFTKIKRQYLIDATQISSLILVNLGQLIFGIFQHTHPSDTLLYLF
jgi:hypothetical protein